MNRDEWLALRREGIGASDIAAICGESPFADANPLGVYLDKLGLLPPKESESMAWGLIQEVSLVQWYEMNTGISLAVMDGVRNPDHPWIMATPDRQRLHDPSVFVELKTSRHTSGWGEPGTDLVPMGYCLQCHWQMMASGGRVSQVDLCASILGAPPVIYHIHADPALHAALFRIGRAFWDLVESRTPPDPDWSHPDTPGLLNLLYRPTPGRTVTLGGAESDLADDWEQLGLEARAAELARDQIRARLACAMGDAEEGILPDGRIVSRKLVTVAAHTRKESTSVRMAIKKGKP